MNQNKEVVDVGIIGGGLAGLAAAIELKRRGFSVLLFEKSSFPFHKVCGEYLSMESWDYLLALGINLSEYKLPKINYLNISTEKGILFKQDLEMGGFGISRYLLDALLFEIAQKEGVNIFQNCEITAHRKEKNYHELSSKSGSYKVKLALGTYGKRSKMDKWLGRKFMLKNERNAPNFIGVKYHIEADLAQNLIELHLFKNGYCGISKIEGKNRYCLCYLTLASNLKKHGSIDAMEKAILYKNPILKNYLTQPRFFESPLSIAQIYFNEKSLVENHLILLGDAAGLISPLSGNGMSMALRSAHHFSAIAAQFLEGKITEIQMEYEYEKWWKKQFESQLKLGRLLQRLFFSARLVNFTLPILNKSSRLSKLLIRKTHGDRIL